MLFSVANSFPRLDLTFLFIVGFTIKKLYSSSPIKSIDNTRNKNLKEAFSPQNKFKSVFPVDIPLSIIKLMLPTHAIGGESHLQLRNWKICQWQLSNIY